MTKILISLILTANAYAFGTGKSATAEKEDIREVQQQLNKSGYPVGRINGTLNSDTQQAIKDFQASQGLSVTGQLDEQTKTALRNSLPKTQGPKAVPIRPTTKESNPQTYPTGIEPEADPVISQ